MLKIEIDDNECELRGGIIFYLLICSIIDALFYFEIKSFSNLLANVLAVVTIFVVLSCFILAIFNKWLIANRYIGMSICVNIMSIFFYFGAVDGLCPERNLSKIIMIIAYIITEFVMFFKIVVFRNDLLIKKMIIHKEWDFMKKDLILVDFIIGAGIILAKLLDFKFTPQYIESDYQTSAAIAGPMAATFFQVLSYYGIARYKFIIKNIK